MKRLSDQTLYEILEVPTDASSTDIERAYDRARALYGPGSLATYTLMAPEEAALLVNRLEEAKAVLLDPAARARYDERLGFVPVLPPPPPPPPAPPAAPVAATPEPVPAPAVVPVPLVTPALTPAPFTPAHTPAPRAPPIQLKHEVSAAREVVVPDGAEWTGEMLRKVRESRGLTVVQLSERTKITRHHIENIEGERFPALPAPVYLRGILMSLARELRLDGHKVARSYLDRVAGASQAGEDDG